MINIRIFSIIIFIQQTIKLYSYEVVCDYMGNCSFIINNKTFEITPGKIPLYNQINNEKISYKLNNTFYPLKLEKQIDGVSNYGLLKGSKNGYECTGGLWECKDSCCLDGFCVEILFYCDKEDEDITFIAMIIGIFFVTLIVLYWSTYCFLGFKFKDDLTKTLKEEKELYFYFKRRKENTEKDLEKKDNNISSNVTENYVNQVPIKNNVIKNKKNVL